jgi:hypothetical protein
VVLQIVFSSQVWKNFHQSYGLIIFAQDYFSEFKSKLYNQTVMKFSVPVKIRCFAIIALFAIAAALSVTKLTTLLLIVLIGMIALITSGCFKWDRSQ